MEDLWKVKEMRYRVDDLADRAEYNGFVKRFHDEEERAHRDNLLYKQIHINKEQTHKEKE